MGQGLIHKDHTTMDRWTSPEPLGLQTLHLSSMASKDMLSTVSPSFQLILLWRLPTSTISLEFSRLEVCPIIQPTLVAISRLQSWQPTSETMWKSSLRTAKIWCSLGTLMGIPSLLLGKNISRCLISLMVPWPNWTWWCAEWMEGNGHQQAGTLTTYMTLYHVARYR